MILSLPACFSLQEAMLSRHAFPEKSVPTARGLGLVDRGRFRHREARDHRLRSA